VRRRQGRDPAIYRMRERSDHNPKQTPLFWCMCLFVSVCWFLFYFNFFFIVEYRGRISCFFFLSFNCSLFFSSFHLKIKFLKLLLRFWSCWGFFF
jgi:hypothetical protein